MKRTIHIAITAEVSPPARKLADDELGDLVKTLLDIGQADAQDTLRQGEGNLTDAKRAVAIEFQSITVSQG